MKSLAKKQVIDIENGQKLGILGNADLVFDPETGSILSLVVINQSMMGTSKQAFSISWDQIETIGEETILLKRGKQ
nr:YlmC/YmxH family sporulation protein [Halobacillus locisalis]